MAKKEKEAEPSVDYKQVFQSLSQAVAQVRSQYNGRIVSAETQVNGNCEVHIIKVLTADGKVKTVKIQGRSKRP